MGKFWSWPGEARHAAAVLAFAAVAVVFGGLTGGPIGALICAWAVKRCVKGG